jgi:hypothetical protein
MTGRPGGGMHKTCPERGPEPALDKNTSDALRPRAILHLLDFGSGAGSSSCAGRGPVRMGIPVINP